MFDYKNYPPHSAINLANGLYIWILHASKIPPHIGISLNGNYFSLKANGKDVSVSYASVLEIINKRNIPTLFLKIIDLKIDLAKIENVFKTYDCAKAGHATCLFPITELLLNEKKDIILKELLEILVQKNYIETVFSLHLDADFTGIPDYDKNSINERLNTIHAAKRTKSLPESC